MGITVPTEQPKPGQERRVSDRRGHERRSRERRALAASSIQLDRLSVPALPLLGTLTDGALITAKDGTRLYSNAALDRLVGGDARRPLGSTEPPTFLPADQTQRYRGYVERLSGGELELDVLGLDWEIIDSNRRRQSAAVRLIPLADTGLVLWLFMNVEDSQKTQRVEHALGRIARELSLLEADGIEIAGFAGSVQADPLEALTDVLSRREREIVSLLLEGHRVAGIADLLVVSQHTVRNHLKSVFRKLDVHSQSELVEAIRSGSLPA